MPRRLELLPVPTGEAVSSLIPRLSAAMAGEGPALLPVSASDPLAGAIAVALQAGEPLADGEDAEHDPTAVVIATSGSTGAPKGALLATSALRASAAGTHERLGGPGSWLLALPVQHIAGLQVMLRATATGARPHVIDTAEPFTADRFVAAVEAMRAAEPTAARRYVSLVPTQLHRILANAEATAAAATFDAVLVGGAAASASLLTTARTAGIPVVTTYGMTETCGGCVYDDRPLSGIQAVTDEDGRISLSGPVVARGYRGRPKDPAFGRPATFVTDDWGSVDERGNLTVFGRLDDVIVTGGIKVAPAAVEARLGALPGVGLALVVGVADPQWGQAVTAVITADGPPPDLESLRRGLADLPPAHRPRRLLVVDEMPLLGPGKPDRRAARALAEADHPQGRGVEVE
jgi:O-succinylbenzoic acid--CoA ligase